MADQDAMLAELLRTACSVDADVRLRSLALQRQCETLEHVCTFIRGLETRVIEREAAQQADTSAMQQSIQDAISRARKVRAELAAGGRDSDSDSDGEEEQQLGGILAIARATRAAQETELEPTREQTPAARLEYPRQLRALEARLEDLRLREREASARFAFCCKMSEHLSLGARRRQLVVQQQKLCAGGRTDAPVARIQESFPKQEARLRAGYQRLAEFLLQKIEVDSPKFLQIADAPTFASVFPVYHRLKQAKKMLRLLNSEAKALLERLPTSPPKLSSAAVAHRDEMLKRIRRKQPRPDVGVFDNAALQVEAQKTHSHFHADPTLLEKLQAAWGACASADTEADQARSSVGVYSTTVREIVLTELSNLVLWSFKTYFADTGEQPDASQVEAVMRLVRLVDSVALWRGRAYRSVVAPS
ncbi:OHCU decarboxylase [Phytophthora cinnamomi]|uniref:OHCU decarboxylase n=1 Tax=Phytophthora cinnamomi TaxID=4785 RepID=UPI00355A1823|nr:OHCU decarboxylase [Phytophthora cinnamomi]